MTNLTTATTQQPKDGEDTIVYLPTAELHDSPFNREHFTEEGLQGLADNLKAAGQIYQALLVRPREQPLFAGDPNGPTGHEIVFGHRRRKAASMNEWPLVPCRIKRMTDEEVQIAQISENIQREDVHPLEEAKGFATLMNLHKKSADDVAELTGKSRSYVYGRLRLLEICPEVREACLAGRVGSETALLIARVGHPKFQARALSYIKGKYLSLEDGGQETTRRIEALLNEHFTLDLKQAIFDGEDATLVQVAGKCSACPKRSANAPEFADLLEQKGNRFRKNTGPNVCTDPECYQDKKAAHLARKAEELKAKGAEVIAGNRARALVSADGEVKGGYVPADRIPAELKSAFAGAKLGPDAAVQIVVIQDPRSGKTFKAAKLAQVQEAATKLGYKGEVDTPDTRRASISRQQEALATKEKERLARENARRRELLDRTREAMAARPRDAWELKQIARWLLQRTHGNAMDLMVELYGVDTRDTLLSRLDMMSPDQLGLLAMDCLLVENVRVSNTWNIENGKPTFLRSAAQHYGVTEARSTPSTARASSGLTKADAKGKAGGGKGPPVKYRNTSTGETWSGRGLQPAWLKAAIAAGRKLSEFMVGGDGAAARAVDLVDAMAAPGAGGDDAAAAGGTADGKAAEAGQTTPAGAGEDQSDDGRCAAGSDAEAAA